MEANLSIKDTLFRSFILSRRMLGLDEALRVHDIFKRNARLRRTGKVEWVTSASAIRALTLNAISVTTNIAEHARQHRKKRHACAPAVGWHANVAKVFVLECQNTFWREIRYGATNMQGFLVSFWTCKTEVGDLDAWVRSR